MAIVLQLVGALAALIGVVTIGIGIPVKEFSFGNTLIVAGTAGLCTGLILLGISVLAMELRQVARRLAAGNNARPAADPRARPMLPAFPAPVAASAAEAGPAFPPPPIVPQAEPPQPAAAPWHEEPAGRARQPDVPAEPVATEPVATQRPRRNLMFESSMRKERERPSAPADSRAQPPLAVDTGEARPANFEDAWLRSERPRTGERTAERTIDRAAEPAPRRASRPPQPMPAESDAP